uniref:uncharacterized protein LOC124061209 n=1 Tax=Scatophagus argus TaxID=75038 RepID=UPI001ED8086B|nr:uncharacterized protein LOC124061209 [Scatophagus argus]
MMVDNTVTKPLGLALIVVAHMVLNVLSQTEVTGILGTNITLQFSFYSNVSFNRSSHFAIYRNEEKLAEYKQGTEGNDFNVYPNNYSVLWHIPYLKLNQSGRYWASVFKSTGRLRESIKVQLIVQEENRSSTVPPMQSTIPATQDSGTSSHFVTVLVVSPVMLLAALLPCLIWCLVRTKDTQQEQHLPPQQSSNSTVQETVEAIKNVPTNSVVYSVLDFPKRSSTVLEMNPSDTEYAAVSYLSERRLV